MVGAGSRPKEPKRQTNNADLALKQQIASALQSHPVALDAKTRTPLLLTTDYRSPTADHRPNRATLYELNVHKGLPMILFALRDILDPAANPLHHFLVVAA